MSKTKFTPGTWRKHPLEDGRGIAFVEVVSSTGLQGNRDILCTLSNHADAHLIAAAKDLYEALDGLLAISGEMADGDWDEPHVRRKVFENARWALAKARGK